jgi:hypothetical protein
MNNKYGKKGSYPHVSNVWNLQSALPDGVRQTKDFVTLLPDFQFPVRPRGQQRLFFPEHL